MTTLYAMPKSGNCYKVAWLLHILKIPYKLVVPSSLVEGSGGPKDPEFLLNNPNGQVPLLELDDGRRLAESNAIMLYLADQAAAAAASSAPGTSARTASVATCLLPQDPYERAVTCQWLFFEQNAHEPAVAVRRGNIVFHRPASEDTMQLLLDRGYKALDAMEKQLSISSFIAGGDNMTIADIALFAYTHVAQDGGYDMDRYPNIQLWLERVRQSPGFCGMDILEEQEK